MKTIKTLAAILMASIAVHAWAGECESPSDYVRKVFSADAQVVQY